METFGKFVTNGESIVGSHYKESYDDFVNMIEDYYNGMAFSPVVKSAGAATYGDNGYFNAKFGKSITAAMFSSDNVFSAIGAKPYNHEGVRIALEQASYGLDDEGEFVGLGAGTDPDGDIPDTVAMPVGEFRQPFKELPFSFHIGLSIAELEKHQDDTIAYNDYVDKLNRNYSDLMDKSLLKPINGKTIVKNGYETSVNSLRRLIGSSTEIGKNENGKAVTEGMVSPYGGLSPAKGDFYAYRSAGESNMDCNVLDLDGAALSLAAMRKIYTMTYVNWADSGNPNNKVWFMSNLNQDKIAALQAATNQYFDSVYIQKEFNGVKTVPGRDIGFIVKSFNNVPIIQSGNMNFDFSTKRVSATKAGDILLADLNHLWISMLTPLQLYTVNNPAITGQLREKNLLHMRAETRIDSFIQHGKIIGIGDYTA